MSNVPSKILCVDDEPQVLEGFRRHLRNKFTLDIATSAKEGIAKVSADNSYTVIVTDLRMPEMNGVEFLKQLHAIAPFSIKIMLTGNLDQGTATRAINEGHVYRFLTKPCSTAVLEQTIQEAITTYHVQAAERSLMQNTLSGCIKLLTDILSLTNPQAFGENVRLRQIVKELCSLIRIEQSWDIELAAMLWNIGAVALPDALTEKIAAQSQLTPQELSAIESIPITSERLLKSIPKLEDVAQLVLYANKNFDGSGSPTSTIAGTAIPLGSRVLRIARELLKTTKAHVPTYAEATPLKKIPHLVDQSLVDTLIQALKPQPQETAPLLAAEVSRLALSAGHRLMSDLTAKDGRLLLNAGTLISDILLERIRTYAKASGVKEPIIVDRVIPQGGTKA
jgi:response regulator RpfG family c-di-GMP phosphodiesterase